MNPLFIKLSLNTWKKNMCLYRQEFLLSENICIKSQQRASNLQTLNEREKKY